MAFQFNKKNLWETAKTSQHKNEQSFLVLDLLPGGKKGNSMYVIKM